MSVSRLALLLPLIACCALTSAFHLRDDEELTHDEVLARIRPTLSPVVRAMLDEIQADPVIRTLPDIKDWQRLERAVAVLSRNSTFRQLMLDEGRKRMQARAQEGPAKYEFPCEVLPRNGTASTVHELTPGDISVVAAMGDSITAGNGISANTILGVLLQYRGQSWSVGGDDSFDTNPMLPNILRKYNSGVWGYSVGICRAKGSCANLNRAVPGTTGRDMAAQAREVVEMIRSSQVVDFENDWKLVTIFIGQNDICSSSCKSPKLYTAEIYNRRLRDALDILYNELPRTFVNLVSMVDAYECSNLNIGTLCTVLHLYECPCAAFSPFFEKSKALNEAFQRVTRTIASDNKYRYKQDFAIVLQPFFQKTLLPRTPSGDVDLSYFAPDCFHFSEKGHAEGAKSLWNNMLEPVGQKKTSWHHGMPFECPTKERPYFCTYRNCGASDGK